ncbi:MAG: DUF4367 domain-containing protein [Clostridia bacterium]|nr:DUF4367 domain-containing protein [Clostridia bacterium]
MRNETALTRALRYVTEEEIARFDALPLVEWEPSESYREKIAALRAKTDRAPRTLSGKRLAAIIVAAIITMLTITACVFKEEIIVLKDKIYEILFEEQEIVFENHEDHSKVVVEPTPLTKIEVFYEPSMIPENYQEVERKESDIHISVYWEDEIGALISFEQALNGYAEISFDTEHSEVQQKIIEDKLIYYVFPVNSYLAFWRDKDYTFCLFADNIITVDQFFNIVKSVTLSK